MIKNIGMLQQLFDTLYAMMHEEVLLLKIFENTHLNNCHTIKNQANEFLGSVEKFIPELQKSKVCVFCYLSALDFHSYCSSCHTNSLSTVTGILGQLSSWLRQNNLSLAILRYFKADGEVGDSQL